MAHQSLMFHFIVCRNFKFFHKIQDTVQDLFIHFHTKYTVCIPDNAVRSAGIESDGHSAVFVCPNRKLCLITVAERLHPFLVHADNRMHNLIQKFTRNFSDPLQITAYLRFFKCKLCRVLHLLYLTSTAFSRHRTDHFLYAVFRRSQDIHQAGITVILLGFHDLCLYNIPYNGIFDEQCIPVHLADAFSSDSDIFNFNLYYFILLHH